MLTLKYAHSQQMLKFYNFVTSDNTLYNTLEPDDPPTLSTKYVLSFFRNNRGLSSMRAVHA